MQTTLTLTPEPSAPETAPELYLIMEEEKLNVCGFAGLGATLTGGRRAADWFPALSEHGRPRKWVPERNAITRHDPYILR